MPNIKVVIGSNYGDEGKGLMTDYFANKSIINGDNCIVVCSNGGSQRGHTVITPDSLRHVFHHFGSGVIAGADTYLPSEFIINPIVFKKEYKELSRKTAVTKCIVNPICRITTPFDMLINQIAEQYRKDDKHGSCGLGIWETVVRNLEIPFIATDMFVDIPYLSSFLKYIRSSYLPKRLLELDVKSISTEFLDIIFNDNVVKNYIDDIQFMLEHVEFSENNTIKDYKSIIFEGGQGLLLDQDRSEDMPYLTASNTGLKNPIHVLKSCNLLENIEVCYVTRSYLTRHGAGNLQNECSKDEINPSILDLTNIPNEYQGSLRFAKLNINELKERILNDLRFTDGIDVKTSLAITHLNEFPIDVNKFTDILYLSDGQTRNNVN